MKGTVVKGLAVIVATLFAAVSIIGAIEWLRDDAVKDFVSEMAVRQAEDDAQNLKTKAQYREELSDVSNDDLVDFIDRNGWLQRDDVSPDQRP
ncbi:MAG: hypothetical protein AAFR68_04165 [Pseudomonadota bacterium]